jgi:hypothetical protein
VLGTGKQQSFEARVLVKPHNKKWRSKLLIIFFLKGNQSMPAQQQGQRTPKLLATKFEIFKSIDFDVE